MVQKIKQRYQALTSKEQQGLWLILMIGILLTLYGVYLIPQAAGTTWVIRLVSSLLPLAAGICSLISAGLILYKKIKPAAILFGASFLLGALLLDMVAAGFGFVLAIMTLITLTYFSNLVLEGPRMRYVPVISIVIGGILIFVDNLWPFDRDIVSGSNLLLVQIAVGFVLVAFIAVMVRNFASFSLRMKLGIGFLTASVVPVILIGYSSKLLTESALIDAANEALLASASQASANIDSFVLTNLNAVRTEAQNGDIIDYLEMAPEDRAGSETEAHVMALLLNYQNRNPDYINSYGLLDLRGIDLLNTNPIDVGQDKSNRDYFIETMRTGLPFMGPVEISPILGTNVIFFAAPVRNANGEILGVLRARYDADVLQQQLVQKSSVSETSTFFMLVDDHHRLLANTKDASQLYKSVVELDFPTLKAMIEKNLMPNRPASELYINTPVIGDGLKNAGDETTFTGQILASQARVAPVQQAGAVKMATRPWYMVSAVEQEQLLAPVNAQTNAIFGFGIVISLLTILLGGVIANLLANPILKLAEVANRVSRGDLSARAEVAAYDEIGVLAGSFNSMTLQLNNMVGTLEQRVADRTRALSASAEVSRRLSTILQAGELVKEVVEQLQSAFNFYHVHIYLFDPRKGSLVMAGGTGEVGRAMLARGHKIEPGRGLVGRAAETGFPILVRDVTREPSWLPNPLLPDTKSELAMPIMIGDNVMGVLDVQQDLVDGLQQEDVNLLQSISNQVAIALQNAATYQELQRQASREALISAIGQRIQRTSTTEEALKVALREIGRVVGAETAVRLKTDRGANGNGGGDHSASPS